LGWSALAIAPFALGLEGRHTIAWSSALLAALAFNWLIATALAYWWWGRALTVLPAPVAGQIVTLVPVVALLASTTLAGERVDAGVVASLVLIGAGIVITLRARARGS
jgi:drug/metabolite transporter (DMT)-like permease